MKKFFRNFVIGFLAVLLVCMPVVAMAEDGGAIGQYDFKISIPIEVKNGGVIELVSVDGSPEDNNNKITVKDKGEFELKFTDYGNYRYKIRQIKGTDPNTTYDSSEYTVDIFVGIDEKTSKNIVETVLYKTGTAKKSDAAIFENSVYTPKPSNDNHTAAGFTAMPLYIGGGALALLIVLLCVKSREDHEAE